MQGNTLGYHPLMRTLTATALAISLHAGLLGALMTLPGRGENPPAARDSTAIPTTVGIVSINTLRTSLMGSFKHAARDLRHAERNMLRSIHHGVRAVGAIVSWSGAGANAAPTC